MEPVRVTDLRQWAYCPRIVYYNHTMPGAGRATFKMEEGKAAQEMVEALELRRTLAEYGMESGRRRFGVWLHGDETGLTGKLDMLVESGGRGAVVEFKLTSGEPGENHRLQLAGYALLVHDALGLEVEQGFVYRIPDGKVFRIALTPELKERAAQAVAAIRDVAEKQVYPERTRAAGRCVECEYANYCADVW